VSDNGLTVSMLLSTVCFDEVAFGDKDRHVTTDCRWVLFYLSLVLCSFLFVFSWLHT